MPISAHLRETVFLRDARRIWKYDRESLAQNLSFEMFLRNLDRRRRPLCLVELLDPRASARCSGRWTLEHVKDQPMMGKKAPDDERHLVVLCLFHNSDSPPSRSLRQSLRAYLANAYAAAPEQGSSSDEPSVEAG